MLLSAPGLTAVDDHLVRAGTHDVLVVALVQLAESRKTRRPHPDLECLPRRQVRGRVLSSVAMGPARSPIRRGANSIQRDGCVSVQVGIGSPCNVGIVLHLVRDWVVRVRVHQCR